jgi:uncharacterized protein
MSESESVEMKGKSESRELLQVKLDELFYKLQNGETFQCGTGKSADDQTFCERPRLCRRDHKFLPEMRAFSEM